MFYLILTKLKYYAIISVLIFNKRLSTYDRNKKSINIQIVLRTE